MPRGTSPLLIAALVAALAPHADAQLTAGARYAGAKKRGSGGSYSHLDAEKLKQQSGRNPAQAGGGKTPGKPDGKDKPKPKPAPKPKPKPVPPRPKPRPGGTTTTIGPPRPHTTLPPKPQQAYGPTGDLSSYLVHAKERDVSWYWWWLFNRDRFVSTSRKLPAKTAVPAGSIARPYDVERARAIGALVKALGSTKYRVKAYSALALARIAREDDAVADAIRALLGDSKAFVRQAATLALGIADQPRARQLTRHLAARGNADDIAAAYSVIGLGFTEENLETLLQVARRSRDPQTQLAAMIGLKAAGDPRAIDTLLAIAGSAAYDREVRSMAISALASIDREGRSVRLLSQLANGNKKHLTISALLALGNIRTADARRALTYVANHGHLTDRTRGFLYLAVGRNGLVELRPWLERQLRKDKEMIGYAAVGLGLLGDRAAIPALLRMEQEVPGGTRMERGAITLALGLLRAPQLAERAADLAKRCGDTESMVLLIEALGLLGKSSPALQEMLTALFAKHGSDYEIRRAVVVSLCMSGQHEAAYDLVEPELKSKYKLRQRHATRMLGEIPDLVLATRPLTDQLWTAEDDKVRMQAAIALGHLLDRDRWDADGSRLGTLARLGEHFAYQMIRKSDLLDELYRLP